MRVGARTPQSRALAHLVRRQNLASRAWHPPCDAASTMWAEAIFMREDLEEVTGQLFPLRIVIGQSIEL